MLSHLSFNAILYLTGFLFLTTLTSLSPHRRHILSFHAGIALWGMASLALCIGSLPLNAVATLATLAAAYAGVCLWFRPAGRREIDLSGESRWMAVYFAAFAALNVLFYRADMAVMTVDSIRYVGLGVAMARSGGFPPPEMTEEFVHFLAGARMGLFPLLQAGASDFGIAVYATLFPLASVYLLALLFQTLLQGGRDGSPGVSRAGLPALVAPLLAVSTPAFWYHAFYVHHNLLTAIFFTVALLGVFLFRGEEEGTWLVVAGLALGTCVLLRTEMTFFAALPITLVLASPRLRRREYRSFLIAFLLPAVVWTLYKMSFLGLGRTRHEWIAVHLVALAGYGASYLFVHREGLRLRFALRAPLIAAAVLLAVLATALVKFNAVTSMQNLTAILVLGRGVHSWGALWLVTAAAVSVHLLFFRRDPGLSPWLWAIAGFFILRVLLYSFGLFPENARLGSQYQSGSRILLHIMPVAALYTALVLSRAMLLRGEEADEYAALRRRGPRRDHD